MTYAPEMTNEQRARLVLWELRYSRMSLSDWKDHVCLHDPDLALELWPGIFDDGPDHEDNEGAH